jgi:transposase
MERDSERVVIGMDPHKRSVTIEVMTADESVVGGGRFGTDVAGYRSMLEVVRRWPDRVWAIEGYAGISKRIANRLLADREEVVDSRPRSQHVLGCSRPGRAARPTPPTPTPLPWSVPG